MPQYFDGVSIGKMYGIPQKKVTQIIKAYKDVIKPSMQSIDVHYYTLDNAHLINEIYHKTILGRLERQIREELKLPQKKERKVKQVECIPAKVIDNPVENETATKTKDIAVKNTSKSKNKSVDNVLFELFKARLEEYHQSGLITKSQLNELVEYEKGKI